MATSLNPKGRQRLTELHSRFKSGTFSEVDVSVLLVLLREKSNGGPIRELAHSIAHSERNSGEFFRRIRENQSLLNDLGKRTGVLDARYMFSDSEFASNLNETLRTHGFDELDRAVIDLIFLCSLSLLQGGSVKGGRTFGELHLALTSEHIELRADMPFEYKGKTVRAVFPLAAAANRWLPVCNPRAHVDATGPVVVKVENFTPLKAESPPIKRMLVPPAVVVRQLDAELGSTHNHAGQQQAWKFRRSNTKKQGRSPPWPSKAS